MTPHVRYPFPAMLDEHEAAWDAEDLADRIAAFGPDSGFTTEQLRAGLTVPATTEEPT